MIILFVYHFNNKYNDNDNDDDDIIEVLMFNV